MILLASQNKLIADILTDWKPFYFYSLTKINFLWLVLQTPFTSLQINTNSILHTPNHSHIHTHSEIMIKSIVKHRHRHLFGVDTVWYAVFFFLQFYFHPCIQRKSLHSRVVIISISFSIDLFSLVQAKILHVIILFTHFDSL